MSKNWNCDNVARVIGKLRRWDWSIADDLVEDLGVTDWQAVYVLLQTVLDGMKQDEYTQALRNALGRGEGNVASLMERRQQLADELGVRALKVREREEVAIERMAPKVLAIIDAHASVKAEIQEIQDSVQGGSTLVAALLGLQQAVTENTALLREVNERLKRLEG